MKTFFSLLLIFIFCVNVKSSACTCVHIPLKNTVSQTALIVTGEFIEGDQITELSRLNNLNNDKSKWP